MSFYTIILYNSEARNQHIDFHLPSISFNFVIALLPQFLKCNGPTRLSKWLEAALTTLVLLVFLA